MLRVLLAALLCCAIAAPGAVAPAAAAPRPTASAELAVVRGTGRLIEIKQPVGSVVVGDQSIVNVQVVSPQLLYVFGAAVGQTDFTVVSTDDRVLASMRVLVTHDAGGSDAQLRRSHPQSRLRYEIVGKRLVLRGTADDPDEAMAAQRILESAAPADQRSNEATYAGSQQITLKVRFAEVSRNQVYNLGFDWNAVFGVGDLVLGVATGSAIGTAVGAATNLALAPYATGSGVYRSGNINASLVIQALESRGAVQTLAEPNLTVRSGKTAKFRAGGDIPIPVPQQQGTLSIEYKPFGVSLEFTPVLLGGNRIAMRVVPEVSEVSAANAVSFAGATVPSFTTRRVETDIELASGQTFAIAGMFKRDIQRTRDTLPGLSSIPILNTLFASQQFSRGESELVILITPYLVQPLDAAVAVPNDKAGKAPGDPAPPLVERIGFILE